MPAVLNVGGGSKGIPIPPHFADWRHDLLDIDPKGNPDVLADARDLCSLPPAAYDAIYCSHNLEHYHRHDAIKVVRGFHHILKPDGFAQILVPDILAVMHHVVKNNMDPEDALYHVDGGPILVRDVIYGYSVEIERSGCDFFAHKTCFSLRSLALLMAHCGFPVAAAANDGGFGLIGFYFKDHPSDDLLKLLNINRG